MNEEGSTVVIFCLVLNTVTEKRTQIKRSWMQNYQIYERKKKIDEEKFLLVMQAHDEDNCKVRKTLYRKLVAWHC